jgi:hypothetical protein
MNNYDLLNANQKAFIEAIDSIGGIPVEAVIEFLIMESDDFYRNSKYREHYTQLEDCWQVFQFAITHEKRRCISICDKLGDDGLDGHYCADVIGDDNA